MEATRRGAAEGSIFPWNQKLSARVVWGEQNAFFDFSLASGYRMPQRNPARY